MEHFDALKYLALGIAVEVGAQYAQCMGQVYPKPYPMSMLPGQLPGEPPAHCRVAEIVDYPAENLVLHWGNLAALRLEGAGAGR